MLSKPHNLHTYTTNTASTSQQPLTSTPNPTLSSQIQTLQQQVPHSLLGAG
ncbi:hypothetical protein E2C01_101465 [Portunus trituberculatus]|uniref:Uncharacterized protein n=1 Tax=Portunus trituberculatus TaxID=210409 RepID=A0A5B7KM17_PORTR|nr:hypothetical protein [Portunus trituberculatus]